MAPIGTLRTKIVLDRQGQTFHGSEEEVSGRLVVTFNARDPTTQELFGPAELSIALHGRAKTKIRVKRGNHTSTHRGRNPLIALMSSVHSGPLRIANSQTLAFPFRIRFPECIQNLATDNFDADELFDTAPDAPLPPSMTYEYTTGMMHHRFECFVEYRVRPILSISGIEVTIVSLYGEEEGHPVLYEQPRVPLAIIQHAQIRTVADSMSISNKYLLPEDQRPAGFKAKTAAFFKSDAYPTFVTNIAIKGSANLILGEPFRFALELRPNLQQTTAADVPEVRVTNFTVTVKSLTQVRAEVAWLSRVRSEDKERQVTLSGTVQDQRPFSKANDYTKMITFKPVQGLPSTFSTKNITRTYMIDFSIVLSTVAGGEKSFKFKSIPIRLLSRAIEARASEPTSAQIASSATQVSVDDEALPAYEGPPPKLKDDIVAQGSSTARPEAAGSSSQHASQAGGLSTHDHLEPKTVTS